MYTGREVALSVQHLFCMFGATILVPLLTGLNPATALLTAGIGTLIFHFVTKKRVPVFLGSSFAFIPGLIEVIQHNPANIPYAQGAVMCAGLVYLTLSIIVYFIGVERVKKVFPPVVVGPIIILIGISLSFSAVNDIRNVGGAIPELASMAIGIFTVAVTSICLLSRKHLLNLVPIIIGLISGYLLCVVLYEFGVKVLDFSVLYAAPWINVPYVTEGFVTIPKFSISAIIIIMPIAVVTCMEHIGDMNASSAVTKNDFLKNPGLHRTLMGDGLASMAAGLLGGPSNTTYSENTGLLAVTKCYDPRILRLAAVITIGLAFFGKFAGLLQTIPAPVKGGIEIILFGMIMIVGLRLIVNANVNLFDNRNILIVSLILITGLGMCITTFDGSTVAGIAVGNYHLSPEFLGVVVGVTANLLLPAKRVRSIDEEGRMISESFASGLTISKVLEELGEIKMTETEKEEALVALHKIKVVPNDNPVAEITQDQALAFTDAIARLKETLNVGIPNEDLENPQT